MGNRKQMILIVLMVFSFGLQWVNAQNNTTVIAINNDSNAPIISKHIYGHFAEHLGRCIYEGL